MVPTAGIHAGRAGFTGGYLRRHGQSKRNAGEQRDLCSRSQAMVGSISRIHACPPPDFCNQYAQQRACFKVAALYVDPSLLMSLHVYVVFACLCSAMNTQ